MKTQYLGLDHINGPLVYMRTPNEISYNEQVELILKNGERRIGNVIALDEDIAVQRIIGRIPEKDSVVSNWHMGWWKVRDLLIERMRSEQIFQGQHRKRKRNAIAEKLR